MLSQHKTCNSFLLGYTKVGCKKKPIHFFTFRDDSLRVQASFCENHASEAASRFPISLREISSEELIIMEVMGC